MLSYWLQPPSFFRSNRRDHRRARRQAVGFVAGPEAQVLEVPTVLDRLGRALVMVSVRAGRAKDLDCRGLADRRGRVAALDLSARSAAI